MTQPDTYRLTVTLEHDEHDDDGMPTGTETMLRLDVESSSLAEAAAVLSAATDVIAGRADNRHTVDVLDRTAEARRGQ